MTYGIKIAKPGKSVHSTDLRDLSVDMNTFSMFKLHSSSTTSVSFSAGDTEKSATVSHALGYVPAFLVYYKRSDESVERLLPDIPYGVDFDYYPWAYATTTGITVGYTYATPFNRTIVTGDNAGIREELWTGSAGLIVGNVSGSGKSSAIRLASVPVPKNGSFTLANLEIKHVFSGPTNSDTKYKIYGIDEDNVGTGFDWNYAKTSAYDARNQAKVGSWWNFGTDVLDQVNEITTRAGWSSGNAMGFIFTEDGSASDAYIGDDTDTYPELTIDTSGSLTISFRVIIFKDKIAT